MIPLMQARVPAEAAARVSAVLASGYINVGENVAAFERALAARLRAPEVLCLNSCTSALTIALMAAGVRGGCVVTTPMTFVATTTAIYDAGAEPVWADTEDARSCQIGGESVRLAVSDDVRAIMAVAWAGWLPDLARLRAVADDLCVPLILDAAQAFGAEYDGRPLHEWADYVCYSFSPTKHVTSGDGGALICRDPAKRQEVRRLSWFGMDRAPHPGQRVPSDQDIPAPGLKANMNEIAAAIGLAGLATVDDALARARSIAATYDREIDATRDERRRATLPSPWLYTIFVDSPDRFIAHAADRGVAAAQPHRRNDAYPFCEGTRRALPNTDKVQAHYVSLPVGWWLSDGDVERVVEMVRAYPWVVL